MTSPLPSWIGYLITIFLATYFFISIKQAVERLRQFYVSKGFNSTSPDDVDLFTGGLMETTFDGPGELFRAILVDGFCRLRDGDRFWYENRENK